MRPGIIILNKYNKNDYKREINKQNKKDNYKEDSKKNNKDRKKDNKKVNKKKNKKEKGRITIRHITLVNPTKTAYRYRIELISPGSPSRWALLTA